MKIRRRFKQSVSFADRLTAFADEVLKEAEALPQCSERFALLKRAQKAQAAKEIDAWANSSAPGPRSMANRG
jgi:hypothetical protein